MCAAHRQGGGTAGAAKRVAAFFDRCGRAGKPRRCAGKPRRCAEKPRRCAEKPRRRAAHTGRAGGNGRCRKAYRRFFRPVRARREARRGRAPRENSGASIFRRGCAGKPGGCAAHTGRAGGNGRCRKACRRFFRPAQARREARRGRAPRENSGASIFRRGHAGKPHAGLPRALRRAPGKPLDKTLQGRYNIIRTIS